MILCNRTRCRAADIDGQTAKALRLQMLFKEIRSRRREA